MTGKELIIYILENDLENEPVFKNDKFLGFKSISEVAEECNVGNETVRIWIEFDMIPSVHVGSTYIIPANYVSPILKKGV